MRALKIKTILRAMTTILLVGPLAATGFVFSQLDRVGRGSNSLEA